MATEEKQNQIGQHASNILVGADVQNLQSEEITSPMNDALSETFYPRNRRYSRYRSSRGGRNSLM